VGRLFARLRGSWRVAVSEASMLPAIAPGDWLLTDPTIRRWPRVGSVVVFREPTTDALAIKRVSGPPGGRFPVTLEPGQAWLTADADDETAARSGFGPPIDSRSYGPVSVDRLVARAWFRYWPPRRIGRIPRRP
jgi:hypothetical protein